jgi:hypothetical protein
MTLQLVGVTSYNATTLQATTSRLSYPVQGITLPMPGRTAPGDQSRATEDRQRLLITAGAEAWPPLIGARVTDGGMQWEIVRVANIVPAVLYDLEVIRQ